VGRKALHLLSPSDREKAVELKQLWVDIGATSREEAQQRVRVGDYGVVDAPFLHLTDDVVSARANDNRAGTVVILEALRLLSERRPAVNVVALAATREEISYAGAFTASVQLAPLAAFVVDVTHATDYPEADKRKDDEVRLGGGPVITRGSSTNPRLTDELIALAERLELPFAIQASPDKSWTDADAMIQAGRGTATAIISIPTRYMHSPNETISLGDLSACAELIAEMTATITPESDFRP
jgi:endoglucanase